MTSPSDREVAFARTSVGRTPSWLAAFSIAFAVSIASAQTVDKVFPRAPSDGDTTGPRPILRIGVEGSELTKIRYKIVVSQDGFRTATATYDQLEDPSGWAFDVLDETPGGIFRLRQPLPGGTYDWKPFAWNGLEWIPSRQTFRFVVDDKPPAPVDGVAMTVDRQAGAVTLRWSPVVTDIDGKPERVRSYKIYRYEKRSMFFSIRYFQVGETDDTFFRDTDETVLTAPILFYKVSAEDIVGNEADRRY